ncbi:hypothetical protein BUH_4315 [Burkholderia pseudomallei Pakistan 9]|nr:hypothetical protein BUH_4315 [Burkholderia pseudomallei Pakistan 9]
MPDVYRRAPTCAGRECLRIRDVLRCPRRPTPRSLSGLST